MTKNEFVKQLSFICNMSFKDCIRVVDNAYFLLCDCLKVGEVVKFKGFGKFYIKRKQDRVVKSIYTKNLLLVSSKNQVCFKMSSLFKNIVK
ncbi:MAG: HU family DNA-binding protein [Clostridia bacterium]|nr:HU family DNA-binding protein [Clostridia bacterium]